MVLPINWSVTYLSHRPLLPMRAYYFDNIEGDQRLPHDSGRAVTAEQLRKIGVLHWTLNAADDNAVNEIAQQRGYKNRDQINVSKAGLGDLYETKIKGFFEEWVARFWFDVRMSAEYSQSDILQTYASRRGDSVHSLGVRLFRCSG